MSLLILHPKSPMPRLSSQNRSEGGFLSCSRSLSILYFICFFYIPIGGIAFHALRKQPFLGQRKSAFILFRYISLRSMTPRHKVDPKLANI